MLELSAISSVAQNIGRTHEQQGGCTDDKKPTSAVYVVAIIIELILLAWAITRAIKLSSANPDSRALHLLFAVISPVFYLIFSYFVPGLRPAN